MFEIVTTPDGVLHPLHGWLDEAIVAAHAPDCPCGADLSTLAGLALKAGPPEPREHFSEFDCATGLTGYRYLSDAEARAIRGQAKARADANEAEARAHEARLGAIREKARQDPAFKALAGLLGIDIGA